MDGQYAHIERRRQGPKRSDASRDAILQAVRDELADNGWRSFSVDNVARRARASKQTIYKWWPSIGALCVDASLCLIQDRPVEINRIEDHLAHIIWPLEQALHSTKDTYVLRAALLAAADDEKAGEELRQWVKTEIRTPLRMVLADLSNRKTIHRDWDIDSIMDALLGPFWNRLFIMNSPIPRGFSAELATQVFKKLKR